MGLLDKLIASFDNSPDGFSARKLSAFVAVNVAIVATFRYADDKVIINTLIVWLMFALLCLGIITAEQLLRFYKKGDTVVPPEQPEVPTVGDEADKEDPVDPKL